MTRLIASNLGQIVGRLMAGTPTLIPAPVRSKHAKKGHTEAIRQVLRQAPDGLCCSQIAALTGIAAGRVVCYTSMAKDIEKHGERGDYIYRVKA